MVGNGPVSTPCKDVSAEKEVIGSYKKEFVVQIKWIKCQVPSFPYLRCREAGFFLCSSHRFGLIAPSEGYKRANGKAKSTGPERRAVPGDGRQPQANKYNKQRSFYSRRLFPQTKGNDVNSLRIRPVDAGMTKLFLCLTWTLLR